MMAFSLLLMVLISFWVCHIAWGLKAEKCEVKEIKFDGPRVTEIKKVFNCSIDLFGWKMFGWEDELETTRCITSEGCTTFKKGK